eukprot:gene15050-17808_t
MSNPADYHFGLDADLAAKKKAMYDPALENDCRQWIESVTGESINGDFEVALKSGVVLCNLANKIKPGCCKIAKGSAPFLQMENIGGFLNFCKSQGVATTDQFMTVDLYEAKNMNQVIQCLQALKRIVTGVKSSASSLKNPAAAAPSGGAAFCGNCGTKSAGGKFCGSCGNGL